MTDTVKSWFEMRRIAVDSRKELGSGWTVDDAYAEFPRALDALNKVLALHRGERDEYGCWTCRFCSHIQQTEILYPCATVRAVEGAINDE